jgi:hypothetical protein
VVLLPAIAALLAMPAATLASIVALAGVAAKAPGADWAISVPLGPWDGDTGALPVWLPGRGLSDSVFCVPAEEVCEAWPSCGRAGFWLEGADDAREGDVGVGGGPPAPSSNAANGPVWSVDSAETALLRAPWLRLAWRTALASDTTPDTSYLLKRVDPRTTLPISCNASAQCVCLRCVLCNLRAMPAARMKPLFAKGLA